VALTRTAVLVVAVVMPQCTIIITTTTTTTTTNTTNINALCVKFSQGSNSYSTGAQIPGISSICGSLVWTLLHVTQNSVTWNFEVIPRFLENLRIAALFAPLNTAFIICCHILFTTVHRNCTSRTTLCEGYLTTVYCSNLCREWPTSWTHAQQSYSDTGVRVVERI